MTLCSKDSSSGLGSQIRTWVRRVGLCTVTIRYQTFGFPDCSLLVHVLPLLLRVKWHLQVPLDVVITGDQNRPQPHLSLLTWLMFHVLSLYTRGGRTTSNGKFNMRPGKRPSLLEMAHSLVRSQVVTSLDMDSS